jgi:hypothetical protein
MAKRLIIVDGQSVPVDAVLNSALHAYNASVTATERGFMEDATFLAELRRNGEQPAITLLDDHGSRLQREAARILAAHHIYCVLEPANSSTDGQAHAHLLLAHCGCGYVAGNVQHVQPHTTTGSSHVPTGRRRGGLRRCGTCVC